VIALYAITDHPTPPIPADHDVHVVADGDLAIVCGPAGAGEVTAEALWQHERIVEALMDDRDVLPVRYGTCVSDEAAAARTLADNRATYAALLRTVRGAVELAVRVFAARAPVPAPRPSAGAMTGTDYLRGRARNAAEQSTATSVVHEPLQSIARACTVAPANRAGELLRAAYLVDRDATMRFSARVREIQDDNPQLRIVCTGPWPPYSFARP
jgi:gas vesicle protein GvpL/GvpF